MSKNVIKSIVNDIINYKIEITFHIDSKNNILLLINRIRYDYVLTFNIGDIDYYFNEEEKLVVLKPEYVIKKEKYDFYLKKLMNKFNELKLNLLKMNSEYQKEKFIHDYLCKNVTYEDIGFESHSIIGPLLLGKGVCEGIAKTAQALFKIAGINSHTICGKAKSSVNGEYDSHAWNIVEIENNNYMLDITFDNTISADLNGVRYDFFNVDYKRLVNTHIAADIYSNDVMKCINCYDYYDRNMLSFEIGEFYVFLKKCINKRINNIQVIFY